jgi:transcription antitermination factor NusG
MAWHVLYVKSRNEKKASAGLTSLGIQVYCPLITEYRQWSDRLKKVEIPLISSYIFVNIEDKDRQMVFQVPGIMRYVFWLGKPAIVPQKEIDILREWLQNDLQETRVEQLKPGDKMDVPKGPFKGQEAIVHQVNKNRLQLQLVVLGVKITLQKRAI